MYLNNRYHDPALGSFTSVDPLVTVTGEPYIYGSANPITYSDPDGLCADPGCWELLGVVLRELTGQEKPGTTRQRQLEHNALIADSILANHNNVRPNGDAWYTREQIDYATELNCTAEGLCDPPMDQIDLFFERCGLGCLVTTGATAAAFGALTAVACPAGTLASAGVGSLASCAGLGGVGIASTRAVFNKTSSDGKLERREVLCDLATGGMVPPGSGQSPVVRSVATNALGRLC